MVDIKDRDSAAKALLSDRVRKEQHTLQVSVQAFQAWNRFPGVLAQATQTSVSLVRRYTFAVNSVD